MLIILIAVVAVVVTTSCIKIVKTGEEFIVERLGQYHKTLTPGWHFTIPFADFVRSKVSTRQIILDIPPQSIITKDNVKLSVDNVVFYRILNSKDAIYNIENFREAIMYSTTTNIRAVLGSMNLDEILCGRDIINERLMDIVDKITDAYGVKILSVEVKNIIPPAEIQNAMEKQMKAERDKRATILVAEGQRQSQIEKAEGEKQSEILRAEAERQANIKRAEGLKESQLLEAEGRAKAIEAIAEAESSAIMKINKAIIESGTDERVIALKQIEALKELAQGAANKLILPTDAVSSIGSIAALGDIFRDTRVIQEQAQKCKEENEE